MQIEFLGVDPIMDAAIVKIPQRWINALGIIDESLSHEQPINYQMRGRNVFRFIETVAQRVKGQGNVTITLHTAIDIEIENQK